MKLPRKIVPEQAEVVRRIYREYVSGKTLRRIAVALNADSIRSPRGGLWKPPVLRHILCNPAYCGKVYRRTINKRRQPDGEWVILPGTHEPILPESAWQEAQFSRLRRRPITRAIGSPLLLSGLLKCGYCNSGMYMGGRSLGGYYMCGQYRESGQCQRNSYPRLPLEQDVLRHVFSVIRSEDLFETAAQRQKKDGAAEAKAEVRQLEKLRVGIPERRRRLIELYENAAIDLTAFTERRDELQAEYELLAKRIENAKAVLVRGDAQELIREQFDEVLAHLERGWETHDIALRKSLLRSIIDRIVIADRTFRVQFRLAS